MTGAAASGATPRRALALLAGLGLAVRLLHYRALAGTAFPDLPRFFPESDMHTFWRWAQTIAAGDLLGRATYHPYMAWMQQIAPLDTWLAWWGGPAVFQQAPGYAYALAGLLTMTGGSLVLVTLAQLLIGALQPLVMFALARRVWDGPAALAAAGIAALYGPLIFQQGTLLRDWLPPLVEPLALLALVRARVADRPAAWLGAGGALGAALLVRESLVLFLPLVLLWLAVELGGAPRRLAGGALALGAGLLLALSPLVARNLIVGAAPFALSNRGVEALIIGNAADGSGIGNAIPPSMGGILERSGGRALPAVREIVAGYGDHPGRLLALQWQKLRILVDPFEVPNNVSYAYSLEISPALRLTVGYGALLPLAVVGMALAAPGWRRHWLVTLHLLSAAALLMATMALARYRMALLPGLLAYAGFAVGWAVRALRAGQRGRAAVALGAVLATAAVQHWLAPLPALSRMENVSVYSAEYVVAAHVYGTRARFDRAVAELERFQARLERERAGAAEISRARLEAADYRALWADQLLHGGQPEEARREAERASQAYGGGGGPPWAHHRLGAVYQALGDQARARAHLRRFLELTPSGPEADAVRALLAH